VINFKRLRAGLLFAVEAEDAAEAEFIAQPIAVGFVAPVAARAVFPNMGRRRIGEGLRVHAMLPPKGLFA
jgi:hypothetical protein